MSYPNAYLRDRDVVRMLRVNPGMSNRRIAEALGTSHPTVGKVRERYEHGEFDGDPEFAGPPTWVRRDLPRFADGTPNTTAIRRFKRRDVDDLIGEVSRLMDENEKLRRVVATQAGEWPRSAAVSLAATPSRNEGPR